MIGRLFEHAGPLVERLAREAPVPSTAALLRRAREILMTMPEAEQIAVLDAHPRIGERPDTVRAQSRTAYQEQGYDREATPAAALHELARLNREYEQRFGFRFVVFVNRRPKAALVPVLRARLERSRADELVTALEEVLAIAADRAATEGVR